MADIYQTAWAILKDRVARSRKQSIPRTELLTWQLQALEAAVDKFYFEGKNLVADPGAYRGEQEKA
ncbi:hypothetical protein LCGC14_1399670 [marine sediment metagenome]|uniref:Uncharacterized protein n=1 Tax=marine sediment metagenome TaxID=412755 RepID=A0A0F9MZ08_9ZZZZ